MTGRTSCVCGIVCAIHVGFSSSALADFRVSVDLRTDLVPQVDIVAVRTSIRSRDPVVELVAPDVPLFTTTDLVSGIRTADFEGLPEGDVIGMLELLAADESVVVRRRFDLDLREDFSFTAVVQRPMGTANQSLSLVEDRDDSGSVSVGDTVRILSALAEAGSGFRQAPGPDLELVVGSVTTTRGLVVRGNVLGDTEVEIEFDPPLGPEEAAFVRFDAVVRPELSTQGLLRFAEFSGDVGVLTDSVLLPGDADPTAVAISDGGSAACAVERAACARELDACDVALDARGIALLACETDRKVLERRLDVLLADSDEDGVTDERDVCAGTAFGAPIDGDGCSRAQFCTSIRIESTRDLLRCRVADWRNDAFLIARDCTVDAGRSCVPR